MYERLDRLREEVKRCEKRMEDAQERLKAAQAKLKEAEATQILSDVGALNLTPEQLKDIGLTREQAHEEGLKPFWRI